MKRAPQSKPESWPIRIVRSFRHPLRAFTLAVAVYALVGNIALGTGVVAAILGAVLGVPFGEWAARSRYRTSWLSGIFVALALVGWLASWSVVHLSGIVDALGTGGALHLSSLIQYGGLAWTGSTLLRILAKRYPSWLALEVCLVVFSLAVALSGHRHGVIARPLWLSDFAWRQGIDPANIFLAVGIIAALVSVSLLVFERRGKLSLAAIGLVPLVALIAVSCLDIARQPPDLGETTPESTDEEGDPGQNDAEGNPNGGQDEREGEGQGDDGADAGQGQEGRGGDAGQGQGGSGDAGLDGGSGGGGQSSGDGGATGGGGAEGPDGGSASESDGGGGGGSESDGGGGEGGSDAGVPTGLDGGNGGGGSPDAGTESDQNGSDSDEVAERPPPDQPTNPSDLNDQPPPSTGAAAAPVAVVLFENDYSPPSGAYYFRQESWSAFRERRLVPSTLEGADTDLIDAFPLSGRAEAETPPPEEGRAGVRARVVLVVDHPEPFGLESLVWIEDIRNPNRTRFRRAYRTFSRAQSASYAELIGRNAGDPSWSDELRELYLTQHPDTRFADFANEVIESIPEARRDDPFTRVVAIKLRLDSMLKYSVRERHANTPDPTVDFFFGNRIGYCVHFAHTAVFLYRAAGIPARISAGYMVAETRRGGGSSVVLQTGDAHAWPEIYLEDVGWVVMDIAAEEILDPPGTPADPAMADQLAEMAREEPPDPMEETREDSWQLPPLLPILYWTLTVLVSAILLGLYGFKLWRRLAWRVGPSSKLPWLAHRALLDRLSEAGITREEGETRERFAERIRSDVPSFERATNRVLSASLANSDPRSGALEFQRAEWKSISSDVGRELRRSTKVGRRLLGLLNPLSFWDVR